MKKYIAGSVIVSIILSVVLMAHAQKRTPKPSSKKNAYKGKTYLAGGQYGNGTISKKVFDSLISYGLVAKDSLNMPHPVVVFTFSYAERGVYEDSTGRPQIMTDYYSIASEAGKVPADWVRHLKERSKRGDTATFSEVLGAYQDSARTRFPAEPLKLVITD